MPRSLPGYVVEDTTVFEQPNSGIEYRYARSDGFKADVYLYPLPPQGYLCVERCAESAALALVDEFKRTFPLFVERGYADSMVTEGMSAVPTPPQSWLHRGQHLTLRMVRAGRPLQSHFVVFVGREAILKLRITYPFDSFPKTTVDSFVATLLPKVAPPFSCRAGLANEPGITVSTTQARDPLDFVAALDSLLQLPPSELDYRDPAAGIWRTVPYFEPVDPESDSARSSGVILFARVTATRDSSTAQITAQDACLPTGRRAAASNSSVAGMMLGLRTMAALDSAMKLTAAP